VHEIPEAAGNKWALETLGNGYRKNRGSDMSLARPERKQATATEDFDFHISYL